MSTMSFALVFYVPRDDGPADQYRMKLDYWRIKEVAKLLWKAQQTVVREMERVARAMRGEE
jgi:hypothetical protein|tara:strand:+ start:2009 stop:2191 length:183 start_codon:yes stop_codon:yes gene_type:complete